MDAEFRPVVRNNHLQTIWGTAFRLPPRVATVRETIETPDHDALDLERTTAKTAEDAPLLIALHGLEGSSRAHYVRGALAHAVARGFRALAINYRSCGPSVHRKPQTYHSGFTDDIAFVVERERARGSGPIGLVGFSLGANVTLKYMGERGAGAGADAAVAISTPFDLGACAGAVDSPGFWSWLYRARFLRTLNAKAIESSRRFPGVLDEAAIRRVKTFRQFDDAVTSRLFGFADAQDYWAKSSSKGFISGIAKPTLVLTAEDDPLIPAESIPREAIANNPAITAMIVPHGGHVGFVAGSLVSWEFFAERIAVEFLASQLQSTRLPDARRA